MLKNAFILVILINTLFPQEFLSKNQNSSLDGEFEHTNDIFLLDLAADTCINITSTYSDSISSYVMDLK